MEEHGGALECDLMRSGLSLFDLGGGLRWSSLAEFASRLGYGSATYRELHGQEAAWMGPEPLAYMLADTIDAISCAREEFASAHGAEIKIPRYVRPGAQPRRGPKSTPDELLAWVKEVGASA